MIEEVLSKSADNLASQTMTYHLEYNYASLILLVILAVILRFQYVKTSENNKKFRRLIIVTIFSGFMDTITAYTICFSREVPYLLNIFLNTIYFCSSVCAAYFTEQYVISFAKEKRKIHKIIDHVILLLYFAILIINVFTGIVFDFIGEIYYAGPLKILTFVVPLLYLIHISYILLVKQKNFTKKQLFLNSTTVLFPLISTSIQIMYPTILLTLFGEVMFVLLLLFTLETPDFIELEYLRKNLELEVEKQTNKARDRQLQLQRMSIDVIEALAQALDEKDEYTNGHSIRVSQYAVMIANELGWQVSEIENLKSAALLHDIGKIGIPDEVLQKPGKLDHEEYEIIKLHTEKGGAILHNITSMPNAEIVARFHHEKYDGTGYPEGVAGKNIPSFARIVAIADAYDAMSTRRVYRDALPKEEIRRRLEEASGTQFDPEYLKIFLNLFDQGIV